MSQPIIVIERDTYLDGLFDDKRMRWIEYEKVVYFHLKDYNMNIFYIVYSKTVRCARVYLFGSVRPDILELLEKDKIPTYIKDIIISHIDLFSEENKYDFFSLSALF